MQFELFCLIIIIGLILCAIFGYIEYRHNTRNKHIRDNMLKRMKNVNLKDKGYFD